MKTRKIPMRTCVITKEKLPKTDLIRIVRTPEGTVIIDPTGKANGRGAYIQHTLETVEKAEKSKVLNRHLETEVPSQIYQELKALLEN